MKYIELFLKSILYLYLYNHLTHLTLMCYLGWTLIFQKNAFSMPGGVFVVFPDSSQIYVRCTLYTLPTIRLASSAQTAHDEMEWQ